MNRRGVLGAMVGAVTAGPSAAKAAAAGLNPNVGAAVGQFAVQSDRYFGATQAGSSPNVSPSYWADRLKELVAKRGERRASYMRRVSKLDADLAESRSLSLSAKIRLQAERDEQRDFDEESSRYLDLAKSAVGL